MIEAATSGALDDVATERHPIFNVDMPRTCPGVPDEVLDPGATWSDREAYEAQALELARMFRKNFDRFTDGVPDEVARAGPIVD